MNLLSAGGELLIRGRGLTYPYWSPDGRSFVYAGPDGVHRVDAEGDVPQPGVSGTASWRDDQSLICDCHFAPGNGCGLCTFGGARGPLLSSATFAAVATYAFGVGEIWPTPPPRASHGGDRIVVNAQPNNGNQGFGLQASLYLVDADGATRPLEWRRYTAGPEGDEPLRSPIWSRDDRRICWARQHRDGEGTSIRCATVADPRDEDELLAARPGQFPMAFGPRDESLLFTRGGDLFLLDTTTGVERRLTATAVVEDQADWRPVERAGAGGAALARP